MNRRVGHTLIATAEAEPCSPYSAFFPLSFSESTLQPHIPSPLPCRNIPHSPMAITTHAQEGNPSEVPEQGSRFHAGGPAWNAGR